MLISSAGWLSHKGPRRSHQRMSLRPSRRQGSGPSQTPSLITASIRQSSRQGNSLRGREHHPVAPPSSLSWLIFRPEDRVAIALSLSSFSLSSSLTRTVVPKHSLFQLYTSIPNI